jgi:hypothetical protein
MGLFGIQAEEKLAKEWVHQNKNLFLGEKIPGF